MKLKALVPNGYGRGVIVQEAVDGVRTTTQWVVARSEGLGVDSTRRAAAGDSASDNLAAMARGSGGPRVTFQLRWWNTKLPTLAEDVDARLARWHADCTDLINPPQVPVRPDDLTGLPPERSTVAQHVSRHHHCTGNAELLPAARAPIEVYDATGFVHVYIGYMGIAYPTDDAVDCGLAAPLAGVG